MKPSRTNRKRMYIGCYNHINHENLNHNGNVGGRRKTRKNKTGKNRNRNKNRNKSRTGKNINTSKRIRSF